MSLARQKSRIEQLEENNRAHLVSVMEQIQRAAFRAMSDEDLKVMKGFLERGALFSNPTHEESAALERFCAAGDVGAMEIIGRPLSNPIKAETARR
jgi:hypothetical protein